MQYSRILSLYKSNMYVVLILLSFQTPATYLALWIITDIISASLVVLIFVVQRLVSVYLHYPVNNIDAQQLHVHYL